MPPTPTSAIETRRRAHNRQNSTPNIEVGLLKKIPVTSGLQRANSQRVHRRGQSLDQPRLQISAKLTPTLGPISQDDMSVSISTNNTGPSQYRNTPVAQPSLVEPGFEQNQFHPVFASPLALQSQDFPTLTHSPHSLQSFSPHGGISSPNPFVGSPSNLSPINASQQFPSTQPTQQQINALEEHIKSVYGPMGGVHINIVHTSGASPQKRSSVTSIDNIDSSPIPMKFDGAPDLHLPPTLVTGDMKLNLDSPIMDPGYESPFYSSPNHSVSCSPQAPAVKSFMTDIAPSSFQLDESMLFHSHTTLTDVEIPMMSSGASSPGRSPRPVSIADLSIDGTIEQTGITAEEIQQYISDQDPVNHRWRCLFPGCDAKTFGRRENIRSHVQTHLGDRQFRCSRCGKCFVRQHDLKRHAKIHSGNKPYKCPCGGGFARQDALTRHRQRGMCIGGFPNAVRKQARRGRPRKLRPDMEERLEKAARARAQSMSSSNDSELEDSPSPAAHVDSSAIDTTRLVHLPEDNEIDHFG
jgi:regulatory protein SWI5